MRPTNPLYAAMAQLVYLQLAVTGLLKNSNMNMLVHRVKLHLAMLHEITTMMAIINRAIRKAKEGCNDELLFHSAETGETIALAMTSSLNTVYEYLLYSHVLIDDVLEYVFDRDLVEDIGIDRVSALVSAYNKLIKLLAENVQEYPHVRERNRFTLPDLLTNTYVTFDDEIMVYHSRRSEVYDLLLFVPVNIPPNIVSSCAMYDIMEERADATSKQEDAFTLTVHHNQTICQMITVTDRLGRPQVEEPCVVATNWKWLRRYIDKILQPQADGYPLLFMRICKPGVVPVTV